MNDINEETATPDELDTEPEQEQTAEVTDSESETGDDSPAKEEISAAQKRINEITRQKYDAIRRADELARQKAESDAQAAYYRGLAEASRQPVQQEPPPDRDDFDSDAEFYKAVEDRITKKIADDYAKKQAEAEKVLQAEREASEAQKESQVLNTFVETGKSKFADWEDVMSTPTVAIPKEIASLITAEDPALFYNMVKDKSINKVAGLTPIEAAKEIGKMVAKIQSEPLKQKTTTNAPKPIKGVGGGGAPPKVDLSKLTPDEYMAYRAKQMRAKG